jgi:uridine kinase
MPRSHESRNAPIGGQRNGRIQKTKPLLVAIVGGSGAGKSWLAEKLQSAFGPKATRISLDNFYRDRSTLSLAQRERINFDNPRAIDWPCFEAALKECLAGRDLTLPRYDFKSHCRCREKTQLASAMLVIVEGLWLLHRPSLRRLFDLRIFIECSTHLRLKRRMNRDAARRGRTKRSVRRQFRDAVEPMHARFVAPQKKWADAVLHVPFGNDAVRGLVERLEELRKHSMLDRPNMGPTPLRAD